MRTVGEILKSKRLEKKLTLDQVGEATKIRVKYLEAVEKNDFSKISGGGPIAKGFIKNYAQFLGLTPQDLLAIFRRDFIESKTGQIIPRGMVEPLGLEKFIWTWRMTIFVGLTVLFLALGGYLFYQYSSAFFLPRIILFSPKEGEVLKQNFVQVRGKTDPDATLFINHEMKILAPDGAFAEEISLSPGENKIVVEAVNRQGKKSKVSRKIEYSP